ncbi:MAG TPA: fused MFS/spermidine synthase [Polyangiaceae bacterium]|nr:fused MFS/spermidine synthase [Polyangiaceae bacterium]
MASVALLLFGSGLSALIYEIAWLREFRLVFGASTSANAAVLAVFIGGLGAGGLGIGRRVDRASRPLILYAQLEGAIAVLAALSPFLLIAARGAYIALGGIAVLGAFGAAVVRLLLTMLVLLGPTFLMGGTLPAAVRAVQSESDSSRRAVGLLYGSNTLGAVAGCVLANFWLLETLGTRRTLWLASSINLAVAAIAYLASRFVKAESSERPVATPATEDATPPVRAADPSAADPSGAAQLDAPMWLVLTGAGVVGFVFFLMELVWYRMLAPILGGTVFMFGIILAVALLGIGIGGLVYAALAPKRVSLGAFALTCLVEAAFVAFPYALGDRVATLALLLRPLGSLGFGGFVLAWTLITALVVFPAAVLSGLQFPMLIGLLGQGKERVGVQTGLAYAANTVGAIAGALAGGFGLLPALSVLGCWQLAVWMLAGLGFVSTLYVFLRRPGSVGIAALSLVGILVVGFLVGGDGPTSIWGHTPIAVGRIPAQVTPSPNTFRSWLHTERRAIRWAKDGVESTVALNGRTGWSFVVNGKSDGHARTDAPTQVMVGLVGAILRPEAKRAMVIGLGTGSTAGWLGAIDEMERVDVAELEPAILHVAEVAAPVNRDVLHNPRVHISLGDAREMLLASRETYDLIASEPSNPYRAGVASLFTQEYYRAVKSRLSDDGIFLQWVQAYNVDNRTLRSVYATLASVFPEVETWDLRVNDLLLVASKKRTHYDLAQIREQIGKEPFRTALRTAWRVVDAEGFLSHFVARGTFARAIAYVDRAAINTDDKNLIEFGFARVAGDSSGDTHGGRLAEIRETARARNENRPAELEKEVDWGRVDEMGTAFRAAELADLTPSEAMTEERRHRHFALLHFLEGRTRESVGEWRAQSRDPIGPTELAVVAESYADNGDDQAHGHIERLRVFQPIEADAILGRLLLRQGRFVDAAEALRMAFEAYRTDPWPWPLIMEHALQSAKELAARSPDVIAVLRPALEQPFAVVMLDEARSDAILSFVVARDPDPSCADALRPFEPYIPWHQALLNWRARCYKMLHHAEADRAEREVQRFLRDQPSSFGSGLNFVRVGP